MSNLFNATNTSNTTTENGCVAHSSTLNSCLDLFGQVGSGRGKDQQLLPLFLKALGDDPKTTSQILFWLRDIRGGQGERDLFRTFLPKITTKENINLVLSKTLEVGRADDLFVFENTEFEKQMLHILSQELKSGNSLVAKWLPRKKGIFEKLRSYMKLTPKELRKILVSLSNTVEQQMSANKWDEIEYQKVPSRASMIYTKAFKRQSPEKYEEYLTDLTKGEAKVNAATLYPYDLVNKVKIYNEDNDALYEAQWESLPNYLEESGFNILPVIDVSASMNCSAGSKTSMTCMDVAVSLGLYVAERNNTVFKDQFITFEDRPSMVKLDSSLSLRNRLRNIYSSPWGGSTNIQAMFDLILNASVQHSLKQEDLPSHLIIFSDMQFNQISGYHSSSDVNKTAFEYAKKSFEQAGYELPNVVFWNLHSSDNYPVQDKDTGACLVSGFNPSLLKTILSGNLVPEPTPLEVMLETVDKERYTI